MKRIPIFLCLIFFSIQILGCQKESEEVFQPFVTPEDPLEIPKISINVDFDSSSLKHLGLKGIYAKMIKEPTWAVKSRKRIIRSLTYYDRLVFIDTLYGIIENDQSFNKEKINYILSKVNPSLFKTISEKVNYLFCLEYEDDNAHFGIINAAYSISLTNNNNCRKFWDWFSNQKKETSFSRDPLFMDALRINMFLRKKIPPPQVEKSEIDFILTALMRAGMPGLTKYNKFSFNKKEFYELTDKGFRKIASLNYLDFPRFTILDYIYSKEGDICYALVDVVYPSQRLSTAIKWVMRFDKIENIWNLRGIWFCLMGTAMKDW